MLPEFHLHSGWSRCSCLLGLRHGEQMIRIKNNEEENIPHTPVTLKMDHSHQNWHEHIEHKTKITMQIS